MKNLALILLCAASTCLPNSSFAKPTHFDFKDAFQRNLLTVESDGALERTVALEHAIVGSIDLDPTALREGVKGTFEFDARRFEAGTANKNEFLRGTLLSSLEFPTILLTLNSLVGAPPKALPNAEGVKTKLLVSVTMKGVTKSLEIPVTLTYYKQSDFTKLRMPGNLLKLDAKFEIDPKQFNITFPDNLKGRFSRTITVRADLVGSDSIPLDSMPQ